MNKLGIQLGYCYFNFGGSETIAVEADTVSIERLQGTGHLSRGARGYVDQCVFPGLPNLASEPLKRKVILVHQGDIDDDAVEASVSCVEQQVAYLMGLDDRKPKIIVYQAASVSEGGLVESFVAVDSGFTDDVFFDLYASPGYPEFKQIDSEPDYIPEFLRAPFAKRMETGGYAVGAEAIDMLAGLLAADLEEEKGGLHHEQQH